MKYYQIEVQYNSNGELIGGVCWSCPDKQDALNRAQEIINKDKDLVHLRVVCVEEEELMVYEVPKQKA